MGCVGSSQTKGDENVKKIRKPKPWKHSEPITRTQLMQMRDEFWDTAPHYGGRKVYGCICGHQFPSDGPIASEIRRELSIALKIWDALKAAAEADLTLAQAIIDSAGVIVQLADLTVCYDERGAKYELPRYVLSEPTNLIRES